jgi:hypothetical protein
MKRYTLVLINMETRDEIHSFTWGDSPMKALNRASDQMKEDPATWSGWIPEIRY